MAVYSKNGNAITNAHDKDGNLLTPIYDKDGNIISGAMSPYIYGTPYAFADMSYTDENDVAEVSALHARNGDNTIAYTPTISGNVTTADSEREWVTFSCNILTNGQTGGFWIYAPITSVPCYGGKTSTSEGVHRIKIKLNGNSSYNWVDVRPGMAYYKILSPPATITSISVSALCVPGATIMQSPIYFDSFEVGFSARRAHVMFNLDCSPANFYDVGYSLFEEFGLKCTLQYHISNTDSTAGADSTYLDLPIHNELMAKGYDYATYSGWKSFEYSEAIPMYDREDKRALFEAHAERMWKVNNESGIYAPSCVHGTAFLWGSVYNEACRDYPFLMIRRGNNKNNEGLQTYYDAENRVMEPHFIENAWSASSSIVSTLKTRIDYAISSKQALQIGCHQIMPSDYDTTQDGANIYVGVNAMREVLSYVKTKVNSGDIVCCTLAEYVSEMEPTVYAEWLAYRQHQTE